MKKILTFAVSMAVIFIFLGLMPVHGEAEIYDNVIRLHVLANSDSEEDQELKLKVRDAILEETAKYAKDCDSIDGAREVISNRLDEIKAVAETCIKKEGYNYSVDVELGEENYPTKNYEDFCFPSGRYLSLQVKIGEAEGQNWWCVLFPPLCLSAASSSGAPKAEDALINIGFSGEQYKIITESDNTTYNVRFKILETVEKVLS